MIKNPKLQAIQSIEVIKPKRCLTYLKPYRENLHLIRYIDGSFEYLTTWEYWKRVQEMVDYRLKIMKGEKTINANSNKTCPKTRKQRKKKRTSKTYLRAS